MLTAALSQKTVVGKLVVLCEVVVKELIEDSRDLALLAHEVDPRRSGAPTREQY